MLSHFLTPIFLRKKVAKNFCSFLLTAQVCDTAMVTPFKIVAKNEERGQPQASYLRYVRVYLPGDTVVELQKGRRVLVKKKHIYLSFLPENEGESRANSLSSVAFVVIGEQETGANAV